VDLPDILSTSVLTRCCESQCYCHSCTLKCVWWVEKNETWERAGRTVI